MYIYLSIELLSLYLAGKYTSKYQTQAEVGGRVAECFQNLESSRKGVERRVDDQTPMPEFAAQRFYAAGHKT